MASRLGCTISATVLPSKCLGAVMHVVASPVPFFHAWLATWGTPALSSPTITSSSPNRFASRPPREVDPDAHQIDRHCLNRLITAVGSCAVAEGVDDEEL
jgi:hypothetical protein